MTSVDIRSNVLGTVVFPPNKPLDVQPTFSTIPCVYDYLFFIDFNKNGESILGASNVTGTFWEGTLLQFANAKEMEDFKYSNYYIYATSSDGKFINDDTIALAEDTGTLTILNKIKDTPKLQPILCFKHAERIPQIAVWENSSEVLTCSGRYLNIWDINNLEKKPIIRYENYHLEAINSVDSIKDSSNLFLSAGSDRISCIWDTRLATPATVLYTNEFSSLTSIASNQLDSNYAAVATQAGDVYLLDRRVPKEFVHTLHCFDANIYRIAFSTNSNQLAVCGDTKDVVILSCENNRLEELYRNSEHNGFVRSLKWQEDELWSCGFGKCVIRHVRHEKN